MKPSRAVEFHPEAIAESRAAREWYDARSMSLGQAFLSELDSALDRIAESPDRWPEFGSGTRRYLLQRFPFMVIYRQHDDVIQVLAVAHARRKPGYWKHRYA
jgi:plasmid stabilization system protein ParE